MITPKENQDPIVYGLDSELVSYVDQMMDYYTDSRSEQHIDTTEEIYYSKGCILSAGAVFCSGFWQQDG